VPTSITQVKPGDIVELLPTNQRNRQLRKQEGKVEWRVLRIESHTKCFNDAEGIAIESLVDSKHWRWVQRDDIKLITFKENVR
jgi:hypothetical protein